MCTITFLPYKDGYILTQNRDESPLRADAVFPVEESRNGQKLIFPQDPEGSGSWFVSAKNGTTLCVMNGVYHANVKPGQFAHSRGLIPLHFFDFKNVDDFVANYNFRQLQGFTLLVCNTEDVHELSWDEVHFKRNFHRAQPLIFQSNPLYNAEQKAFRKKLFHQFLAQNREEDILNFHTQSQTANPEIDIAMNRDVVKTVSTVQRIFHAAANQVQYKKLGQPAVYNTF